MARIALVNSELYAVMQFLLRTNARRFDSEDRVEWIVADNVQAEFVRDFYQLPDHCVARLPGITDEFAANRPQRQAEKKNEPVAAR